jgi:hypothetical protein
MITGSGAFEKFGGKNISTKKYLIGEFVYPLSMHDY